MVNTLTLPIAFVLWFIKNISYGQQLNTAQLICTVVCNEQATGIDDTEVKTAVNFSKLQWRCLKTLPAEISSLLSMRAFMMMMDKSHILCRLCITNTKQLIFNCHTAQHTNSIGPEDESALIL